MTKFQNQFCKLKVQIRETIGNQNGSTTMQFALIAAAIAVFAALAIPPVVERNLDQFAFQFQNIDTRTTGSISQTRRYTIRKSITDLNN